MEQEKDNFWLIIGGLIALAIVLVVMLKSREMESAGFSSGYSESRAEVDKQVAKQHQMLNK